MQLETYLITVEKTDLMSLGLRIWPGIRPSQTAGRPAIKSMTQGSTLQLRRPDGSSPLQTHLATYGIAAMTSEDGTIYLDHDPKDPPINLILPPSLAASEVPPGTEIWLVD